VVVEKTIQVKSPKEGNKRMYRNIIMMMRTREMLLNRLTIVIIVRRGSC